MRLALLPSILSLAFALLVAAPEVQGQSDEPVRVAALLDEIVDKEAISSSSAEAQLLEELINAGMVVIDEEQSRKIRSVSDAGRLLKGGVSTVITSLDADVIIVGVCKVTLISETVMGQPLVRYDADIEAKATAVDTGEVIGAFNVRAEAMDLNKEQSAIKAARAAATELGKKLTKAIVERQAGPERVELTINGVNNVLATQALKKAIVELEGVRGLNVLQAARGVSKLAIELEGVDSATLAVAIQDIPEVGLEVWGYSKRAIKADYSPAAALNLPFVVVPFINESKRQRDGFASTSLAEMFQIELADRQFLEFAGMASKKSLRKGGADLARAAKELAVDADKTLFVVGSYRRERDQYRVQAEVVIGASKRALRSGQVNCPPEQFPGCAVAIAQDFSTNLLMDIAAKPKLFKNSASAKTLSLIKTHVPVARPVEIESVEMENLFPSRLAKYSSVGFGKVTIRNRGDKKVEAVTLSVNVKDYASGPLDVPVGNLPAGETKEIPLKVVLDSKALATLDETRPAVLSLVVNYRLGEFRLDERATRSLMVFDRNSISWNEPASLAAFVDPKSAPVLELATALTKAATSPEMRRHPLFLPAYTHEVLRAGKLAYQPDAVNPYREEALDYVKYPLETLASGTGDCDDLAVLYATVLEAAGVEAALLLTPGHVLVAANTGVPEQFAASIWPANERLLLHDGTAWVPIESTLTKVSFAEAWTKGAEELARYTGRDDAVTVLKVRDGWALYPPATIARATSGAGHWLTDAPEGGAIALMKSLEEARLAQFAARMQALDEKLAAAGGSDCDLLFEKARLQVATGQLKDAGATLLLCKGKEARQRVLNNQANLRAMEGKLDDAQASYGQALESSPESVPLHANAGLVAFMRDDPDMALEHFVACLELGAEEEVARLAALGVGGSARGAEGGGKELPALGELMAAAYKKAGKEPPPLPKQSTTRASEAGSGGVSSLLQHLRWL
jgi:TolB-like protein